MADWDNPDVGLLYEINGLTQSTPAWVDRTVAFLGEYGLGAVVAVLVISAWWVARQRGDGRDGQAAHGGQGGRDGRMSAGAAVSMAWVAWAPLAALVAFLLNAPIREFVERSRPFETHDGVEVLVQDKTGFSFVSDHSSVTMAIGVGLFMVSRKLGLAGVMAALLQGLCRVYLGVHYPTDVVGGLALGMAVALLLAPAGMAVLTPLMRWLAGTWLSRLVQARPRPVPAAAGRRAPAGGGLAEPSAVTRPVPEASARRSRNEDLAA